MPRRPLPLGARGWQGLSPSGRVAGSVRFGFHWCRARSGCTGGSNIKPFPDPKKSSGDVSAQSSGDPALGGDSQLRLAGESEHAVAAWTRVTETLTKEPGSELTSDEQMLMMNSTEIFASVRAGTEGENDGWVTTQLTQNGSADMAPAVATNGQKPIVAWRAVAASNSSKVTTFDTNDTILYKIYDYEKDAWSKEYTL